MADVQNAITLGIGSAPGNIRYFVLFGLDVAPMLTLIDVLATDALLFGVVGSDALKAAVVGSDSARTT